MSVLYASPAHLPATNKPHMYFRCGSWWEYNHDTASVYGPLAFVRVDLRDRGFLGVDDVLQAAGSGRPASVLMTDEQLDTFIDYLESIAPAVRFPRSNPFRWNGITFIVR